MDLQDLFKLSSEWYKKQADLTRRKEEMERELNREWDLAHKALEGGTTTLLSEIEAALIDYFRSTGRKIRKFDFTGNLVEVFIGPQAKVSVHVTITQKGYPRKSWMLRNEALKDIQGVLSPSNTVAKLIKVVEKADKNGFWDGDKAALRLASEKVVDRFSLEK